MNPRDDNSKQLFGSLKNRHEKQMYGLFKLYYRSLCDFANQLIHDHQQAKDIVNDLFVRLLQDPDELKGHDDVYSYLITATHVYCLEYLRSMQQKDIGNRDIVYLFREGGDKTVADQMVESEVLQAIYREVEKLPKKRKEVFKLLFFLDLTSDEVARRLQLSRQTVLNQKIRALHSLRSVLLKKGILSALLFILLATL